MVSFEPLPRCDTEYVRERKYPEERHGQDGGKPGSAGCKIPANSTAVPGKGYWSGHVAELLDTGVSAVSVNTYARANCMLEMRA